LKIEEIATGLERSEEGYWSPRGARSVSYPAEGSDFCLSVEEQSFWFTHRNKAIVAAARRFPPADGPVFDVGAGNGYVSAALADAGFTVVPIEPGAGASNAVRRGLQPVVRGTLPSPEFHPHSAGAIGLFDVIEHIDHDVEFLASISPYLKQGGRVYVTVPAHPWLWSQDDVDHKRRYTRATLERTLRSAGYRVEFITYTFWWLPVPVLFFRVIPSFIRRVLRRSYSPSKAEHTAGGATMRKLLEQTLRFEISRIGSGRRVPFGASCLAVATIG